MDAVSVSGGRDHKPFEPTHSRLQKARREGDVARSPEFGGALAFAAAMCGLALVTPELAALARAEFIAQSAQSATVAAFLPQIAACALVPAVCAAAAGAASTVLQGGLHPRGLRLQLERLNPITGFKRIASREAGFAALRAAGIVAAVLAFALPAAARLAQVLAVAQTAAAIAGIAWHAGVVCGFAAAALGLLFATGDLGLAFAAWRKRLRMSYDELKREHKEQDGDPAAKGKRRALHRELSRASVQRLKEAAFVVVNPSHIAVALAYAPPEVPVPRVLLRAADAAALRVREAAQGLRIPVVENVALARELYATAKPGNVIPKRTYVAVAQVVASLVKAGALA